MITVTFEKVISYFCFFHQINFQFDFSFLFRRSKETIFCPVAFLDFNLKVFHSKVSHQDRKKRVIRSIGLFLKGLGDNLPYKRSQSNHSLGFFERSRWQFSLQKLPTQTQVSIVCDCFSSKQFMWRKNNTFEIKMFWPLFRHLLDNMGHFLLSIAGSHWKKVSFKYPLTP